MTPANRSISHEEATINSFRRYPEFALEYLNDVFEEGDSAECMRAFRLVAEAMGGIPQMAKNSGINEKNLQRTLSDKGNPTLKNLLGMVRALNLRLEFSAHEDANFEAIIPDADRYPVLEMIKRGWLPQIKSAKKYTQKLLSDFINKLEMKANDIPQVAYRQSKNGKYSDKYALKAWLLGVKYTCKDTLKQLPKYNSILNDRKFLQEVVKLSGETQGIKQVVSFLEDRGIALVIVPHLKKTYLDGAVFFWMDHPVVALTLRYDRVDYFWFTLLHELAHIVCGHVDSGESNTIFDEFDNNSENIDTKEQEANDLVRDVEIPKDIWQKYENDLKKAKIRTINIIAEELGICKAIVAGRVRYSKQDFKVLSQHIGSGMVRRLFPEAFPEAV